MPVPLIKRGANQAGCLVAILHAGPPSQGAVSGPGQALQGGTLPDAVMTITPGVQVQHFYFFPWEIFKMGNFYTH
jgi:hypothetical protein